MKKKLAVMMVLLLSLTMLASCGGGGADSPTKTVESYLQDVKAHKENLDKYFVNGDEEESEILDEIADEDSEYAKAKDSEGKNIIQRLGEFEYKVDKEKIDGDKAEVDLTITNYDYSKVMDEFMVKAEKELYELSQANVNEEHMEKAITRLFGEAWSKAPKDKIDYKVTLKLTKVKDQWKLDTLAFNDEFMNAVSGGLYSSVNQLGGLDD